MKTTNIRLSTIADVRDFVNIVSKSDIDIDLASGRYLVDGTLTDKLTEAQQTLFDRMTAAQYYLAQDAGGVHP